MSQDMHTSDHPSDVNLTPQDKNQSELLISDHVPRDKHSSSYPTSSSLKKYLSRDMHTTERSSDAELTPQDMHQYDLLISLQTKVLLPLVGHTSSSNPVINIPPKEPQSVPSDQGSLPSHLKPLFLMDIVGYLFMDVGPWFQASILKNSTL